MAAAPRPLPADANVSYSPWRPNAWALVVVSAVLFGLTLGWVVTMFFDRGTLANYEYHLWRWQADTLPSTAFSLIGIGEDPDDESGGEAIERYFALTTQIRGALDSAEVDYALVDALIAERSAYENDVERYVEGLIDDAVGGAGLQRDLPLFAGVDQTWPPVNVELTNPPRLLVRSPREVIRRDGDTLLDPDLSFSEIEDIEGKTDNGETVSIVVPIGGLAAYPAIVNSERSYDSFLETSAHEWVHHYLAFYPLGGEWGKGGDAHVLNETTANIAGRELANLVRTAQPIQLSPETDGRAPPRDDAQPVTVDFREVMQELRRDVDRLLAEGKVEEAEQLMEERRQYLEDNGVYLRKINQAYFAFYGTYGDSPAADPTGPGPKVEEVWEHTQDVGVFLKVMREVRTEADVDRLLESLRNVQAGQ